MQFKKIDRFHKPMVKGCGDDYFRVQPVKLNQLPIQSANREVIRGLYIYNASSIAIVLVLLRASQAPHDCPATYTFHQGQTNWEEVQHTQGEIRTGMDGMFNQIMYTSLHRGRGVGAKNLNHSHNNTNVYLTSSLLFGNALDIPSRYVSLLVCAELLVNWAVLGWMCRWTGSPLDPVMHAVTQVQ